MAVDFIALRMTLQQVIRPFLDESREWRKQLIEESKAWRALAKEAVTIFDEKGR